MGTNVTKQQHYNYKKSKQFKYIWQVLQKIPARDDKLTYSHGTFLLHYVRESGITYMAITDEAFERSKVFHFLNVVKRRFQQIYGQRALTAIPYAMNNDFAPVLASEMVRRSTSAWINCVTFSQQAWTFINLLIHNIFS